jgi:hypothetical protein
VPVDARPRVPTVARWAPFAVVVLAVVPLVIGAASGALGLVRNDDWSYSEVLWHWQDTGDLRLQGWVSMTLVGQLVLALPVAVTLPRHVAALQVFTVVVGMVGTLAAFATLRRFLSPSRAVLAVAMVVLGPLYGPLAVSFMTDVPAYAAQTVCLWCGVRSLESARRGALWFAAALASGLFAVTIREYAIVAPVVVVSVFGGRAWGRRDRAALTTAVIGAAFGAIFVVAFIGWRRTWAHSLSLVPSMPSSIGDAASSFGRSILFTLVTLTFLVLPALAFLPVRELLGRMTSTRWGLVATTSGAVVLVAGAIATWEWSPPLLGPYLDQRGALGDDILPGTRPFLLSPWLLRSLLVVTLLATVLFVGVLATSRAGFAGRPRDVRASLSSWDARSVAWLFVVLTVVLVTAAGSVDLPIFDRYVLPAVPFAAGLTLGWRGDHTPGLTTGTPAGLARWSVLVAFVALGLVWSVDSARFDAARWAAGEHAVELGYSADRVDAGFEWRNVHRVPGTSAMSPSQPLAEACVRLTAAGADLDGAWVPLFTTSRWHGTSGGDPLTAWARAAPDCPPLP